MLEKGSPAAKANLKPYDIIVEFNGRKIKNSTDLVDAVSDSPIGQKTKMKVLRNRQTVNMDIVVGERALPQKAQRPPTPPKMDGQKAPHDLGFAVADLNDELRKAYGYSEDVKRPIIVSIKNGSIASMAGLRVGDLILDVNKSEVVSSKDVVGKLAKETNTLRLARGPRVIVVTIGL